MNTEPEIDWSLQNIKQWMFEFPLVLCRTVTRQNNKRNVNIKESSRLNEGKIYRACTEQRHRKDQNINIQIKFITKSAHYL